MSSIEVNREELLSKLNKAEEEYKEVCQFVKDEFINIKMKDKKWWGGNFKLEEMDEEFKKWCNFNRQGSIYIIFMNIVDKAIQNCFNIIKIADSLNKDTIIISLEEYSILYYHFGKNSFKELVESVLEKGKLNEW